MRASPPPPFLSPEAAIAALREGWSQERDAERARAQAERAEIPWRDRLEAGTAATDLSIDAVLPGPGQRLIVLVRSNDRRMNSVHISLRPGDPVVLFHADPAEPTARHALVERWHDGALGLILDNELPELFEDHPFRLERAAPEVTFERGARALAKLNRAHGVLGHQLSVAYGLGTLARVDGLDGASPALTFFDTALDDAQREAIRHALATSPFSLIHGPPGTGKTRCLVELIAHAHARSLRVLVVAPSNTAVDNLTLRLIAASLPALRLGHPARTLPEVSAHTLAHRLDAHPVTALTRTWVQEATALRRRAATQAARGTGDRHLRREAFAEANRLLKDARAHLRRTELALLDQAPIVCATLAGAWEAGQPRPGLPGLPFDLVVLDEATQAPDPLAWIPLTLAPRAVLAGDPHQLAPTLIDPVAARGPLGTTLFERLYHRLGPTAVRMLTTQHRMHADIMAFPSATFYDERLVAAPSVATHRLEDLAIPPAHPALGLSLDGNVLPDPLRPGARIFIDAAGAGFAERTRLPSGSTENPELAARTAAETRRLLSRGVSAAAVAVITPYDAQVTLLRALLQAERAAGLEVSSIDAFQGREKEAIILDLVRQNDDGAIGFLQDLRRMNVALTRARRFLLILGDSATLGSSAFYRAFLDDVDRRGTWISVFSDPSDLFC